jgi:subtilisin family serine protease
VWLAVVDTGVDRDHPDLAGNVMPGADFISNGDGLGGETPGDGIDNNQDGVVDGNVGHGSHVAGIIAAEAFNGVGACGVAYNTKILPLRIFPANGDTGATFSSIIEAIGYAAEQANVRVISMSIGTTYESSLLQEAVTNAWDAGKVLVAAAANANTNSRYYPGAHEHVVAVAALNKTGQKASFSNYGDWVDISAYGTGIFSTTFNDTYAYMSGTSMACPLVSGCMALLFGYMPSLTNEQAVEFLLQYSDDVDTLNPDYAGQLGSGIVNPYLAMTALENDKPGEVSDGNSEGSFSGTDLELGPYTQR